MVANHQVSCVSEWGEPANPPPQILVGNHPFWLFGCPNVWDIFKSSMEKNLDIEPWFSLTLSLSSSRVDLPRENRRDEGKAWRESQKNMSWENLCTGSTFSEKKPLHPSHSLLLKKLYSKEPFLSTPYIFWISLLKWVVKFFLVQQDMATGSSVAFPVREVKGKFP